ncbi:MAG: helix-turn-helix domain-containing protein [Phyllobacterium sp.]
MSISGKDNIQDVISSAIGAGTNVVRALRDSLGYSVEDLAVASGLTATEIDEIESGQSNGEKLRRIASVLGVPEQLIQRD